MLVTEVTNMKESIIKEIEQKLLRYLDNAQMEILHKALTQCLDNVDISIKNENFEGSRYKYLFDQFFINVNSEKKNYF